MHKYASKQYRVSSYLQCHLIKGAWKLWCQIKAVINGSVRYSQISGTVQLQEEVCICVRPISASFVFSILWERFRPGVSNMWPNTKL